MLQVSGAHSSVASSIPKIGTHCAIENQEIVASLTAGVIVQRNLEGINPCSNGVGVPLGSRGGSVPKTAKAAWLMYVIHKQNEFGNSNFVTIAQLGTSYKIVYEGTSP